MVEREVEERLAALEQEVAELKRRLAGPGISPEHARILAEAREQAARAKERVDHVHGRAHELAEQAHRLDLKAQRVHQSQEELERWALEREDGAEPESPRREGDRGSG